MSRLIDDEERRARLGRKHLLSYVDQARSPQEVAQALTAIHGTDPASTVLGILARTTGSSIEDVEEALYTERSIVRVLGMRRTLFAVDYRLAPAIWSSFENTVARDQRRLLTRMLHETGVENVESWLAEAEHRLLLLLNENPGSSSTQIATNDPYLGYRLPITGQGTTTTSQSVASRLLTLMSAEGKVVRGRPKGSWYSSQLTWWATEDWRSDWPERPAQEDADVLIAQSWLAGHGPATIEDLAWWTGWAKGRTRKAIDRAGALEVQTTAGPAFLLEADFDPPESPETWVALLPGLDSSTMGWRNRGFYLGPHATRLFDNVGNAGPTVWVDGRIVGGWTQRNSGEIVFETLEDVGSENLMAIQQEAASLESLLEDVRLKPRARRYTASELALH
jgi:hypothetical protein